MVWSRLSETLYFFRQHWLSLLRLLLPVLLPASLLINYRYHVVHAGNAEQAAADGLAMGVQLLAGLLANALVARYTLAETGNGALERPSQVWSDALARLPALFVVQIVTGVLIFMGLLLLIVPGIWLMGVLMPAYVLVMAEQVSGIEAVKQAWSRFRPAAWQIAASIGVLIAGLILCMGLLELLENLLAGKGAQWGWLAGALLDVAGLLLAQVVMILLVRFYDLERSARSEA